MTQQAFRKVYVGVVIRVTPEGAVRPMSITFEDGKKYEIDRVRYACKAAATKVGGTGTRYTVVIGGRETYLFAEENGKWFVEAKELNQCV